MREEARGRGKIDLCAFCRVPYPSSAEENIKRIKKLADAYNSDATTYLAGWYVRGDGRMPQDWAKANELYLKAGELGCAKAYCNLGISHYHGRGMEVDKKKAKHYYELAAMAGNLEARHNLGSDEYEAGNVHRAMKHFLLAARAGYKKSLDQVKAGFMNGNVTKDEYANTLRAHQDRFNMMKSDDRDRAVAEARL